MHEVVFKLLMEIGNRSQDRHVKMRKLSLSLCLSKSKVARDNRVILSRNKVKSD